MGIMAAFNRLYPYDGYNYLPSTEEEYHEWISNNLEQYYKEITDGTIEETGE